LADTLELVVRGGTVIDGTGAEPFEADIAIADGRIVEIGRIVGCGLEEIDAKGMLVTPGFVDVHTHYDGQVTWENRLIPSCYHGVTTAIMGNCGVGFAPCKPEDRERLLRLMEGVEDIPGAVLSEGLPWTWETFPEFFAHLAGRRYDIDFGGFVPHAPLRVYVMGQRACDLETATPDDIAQMSGLLREAMQAGAFGFATSRTLLHRSSDGRSTPTVVATEEELTALAMVLGEFGSGVVEFVGDWERGRAVFDEIERIVTRSGRPLTFLLNQNHQRPRMWQDILGWLSTANEGGLPITAQVLTRPLGFLLGHELTLNPFYTTETYRSLSALPFDEKIAALRRPDIRARILAEEADPDPTNALGRRARNFDKMFQLGDPPNYEPTQDSCLAAEASRRGVSPESLAYDLMLERDGRNMLYLAASNYADYSLEPSLEMLRHPNTVMGLGDAGAHLGTICDGSYPTFALSHWARDRTRGEHLPLPMLVRSLTRDTSEMIGLLDRGVLKPGYQGSLNVIDFDRLALKVPEITRDLPAGGRRLVQKATGYVATVVSGTVTYRDGEPTGALPGRLVRGQQGRPANA
jgi:N-acyl-D-aspartate/D-glutamate deacylase